MSHWSKFSRFIWGSTGASRATHRVRKSLLILALLSAAIGLQAHFSGAALAAGSCGPSSQTTKLQYTNAGCIYTNPVWFSQAYQQNAHIKLVFNGVDSKLVHDFTAGANLWTNAGGHVDFSTSCSNCGNNTVTVTQTYDCSQGWWGQGDSGKHTVVLNTCYESGSDSTWQGVIAHELGHTMGLAHNRWNNGGALMFGCDYPGQYSDCIIHLYTPQPVDVDILNAIFPVYSALCSLVPNDENCNNQDYQVQSCNAYPQSPRASDAYLTVTLFYSTNCQSNWTWAVVTGGYQLFHVQIQRGGNSVDVALTLTETPPDHTTTWYTNMIWAPSNSARACAWYVQYGSVHIYGPVCTSWH
jgi:hypothetical protein